MSIKGALNVTATMTTAILVMFGYFTYSASRWIDNREQAEKNHAEELFRLSNRVSRLETEGAERWKRIEEKLTDLKDLIIELKKERKG